MRLDAYKADGNTAIPYKDVAMNFMHEQDNRRYAEFKVEVANDISKEVMDQPENLNAMYVLVSRRVAVLNNQPNVGGAMFTTLEEGRKKGQ